LSYCQWIYRNRAGAFTLLEMLIASAIMAVVMSSALGLLVFGAKLSRNTTAYTACDVYGRRPVEMLKNSVRMGKEFAVKQGGVAAREGNQVDITNPDGTVISYYYADLDGNPATLHNNVLYRREGANGIPEIVLRSIEGVSRRPLFVGGAAIMPLTIQMRLADYPIGPPKTVGIDIVTTVGVRNR
jgi:prepilin-type N-terminal cleavage/methylation domain-containing protein